MVEHSDFLSAQVEEVEEQSCSQELVLLARGVAKVRPGASALANSIQELISGN